MISPVMTVKSPWFPSHFSTNPILRDDPQDGHVSLWDIRASPHVSVVSWPQWPQCPNGSRSGIGGF